MMPPRLRSHAGLRIGVAAFLTIVPVTSRSADPDPAALEFFEKRVRPLLVTHCYECHADGE
ncbi:MAG: hypothetical protein EBU70_14475, partial [Actinobacteria bacterium]|nr:hypothetical protein [Actinomycetota bacterium]